MKTAVLIATLSAVAPCASAAEPFCDTGQVHPIDRQFARGMATSGGVTVDMRNAQGRAFERWDNELNREYRALAAALTPEDHVLLQDAQRAWLSFRDTEARFWWSERITGGGTLQPVIVSDLGRELLKARVCQLSRYREIATSKRGE